MKALPLIRVILILGFVALTTCSEDCKCPTCPAPTQWVEYDNFDDNSLDTELWNYIPDC
jgi:hypothetical protein